MKELIQKQAQVAKDQITEAVKWLDNYKPDQEDRFELFKNRLLIQNCLTGVEERVTNAVYGESQVGKSTFISNFIGNADNDLLIVDKDGNTAEFIKYINPQGRGAEATGLVTRFTYQDSSPEHSVRLELLSPRDLIIILVDSYLTDFKKWKHRFSSEELREITYRTFQPYQKGGDRQDVIDSDDIYFIQYYLDYYYRETLVGKEKLTPLFDSGYWNRLTETITKIPLVQLYEAVEILWGKNPVITEFFQFLMQGLAQMQYQRVVFCDIDAVLREKGALLDVQRVWNIKSQDQVVTVQVAESPVQIDRNILSALSAEVILSFRSYEVPDSANTRTINRLRQKEALIAKTDFLDFPGIRGRMDFDENHELTDKIVTQMLLRGKVEYLFNRYDITNRIDNFFIVTVNENNDTDHFRVKLANWVNQNLGFNAKERGLFLASVPISPLFVIFNKWDGLLEDNRLNKNENMDQELWARVEKALNENIYPHKNMPDRWNEMWTESNPNFQNIYPFRAIKYSDAAFNKVDGQESFKEGGYHQRLTESFLNSPHIKKVFGPVNVKQVWENSSVPNMDGCDYLLANVMKAADPLTKQTKYKHILNRCIQDVQNLLERHYESESHAERLTNAENKFRQINQDIQLAIVTGRLVFGEFIESFLLSENDTYNLFHTLILRLGDQEAPVGDKRQPYILIWKHNTFVPLHEQDREESDLTNLQILQKYWGESSIKSTEARCQKERLDLDLLFYGTIEDLTGVPKKSEVLSSELIKFWRNKHLQSQNHEMANFFTEDRLATLCDALKKGFEQLELQKYIRDIISPYVDIMNNNIQEPMIAHLATGLVNGFVTSAGWKYYSEETRTELKEVVQSMGGMEEFTLEKTLDITEEAEDMLSKQDVSELLDQAKGEAAYEEAVLLDQYHDWLSQLCLLFLHNTGAKASKPGNDMLGDILSTLKKQR